MSAFWHVQQDFQPLHDHGTSQRSLRANIADVRVGLMDIAHRIVRTHPSFTATELIGIAFDSLFRQIGAEQALATPEGRQVLAPFAIRLEPDARNACRRGRPLEHGLFRLGGHRAQTSGKYFRTTGRRVRYAHRRRLRV